VSCGLELDCGSGETERAGVYLQQRRRAEYVTPFFESVGEGDRASGYEEVRSRMPVDWPPSYAGLSPVANGRSCALFITGQRGFGKTVLLTMRLHPRR